MHSAQSRPPLLAAPSPLRHASRCSLLRRRYCQRAACFSSIQITTLYYPITACSSTWPCHRRCPPAAPHDTKIHRLSSCSIRALPRMIRRPPSPNLPRQLSTLAGAAPRVAAPSPQHKVGRLVSSILHLVPMMRLSSCSITFSSDLPRLSLPRRQDGRWRRPILDRLASRARCCF